MIRGRARQNLSLRSGVAVVELAVLLPLIVFLLVLAIDFARVFYYSLTLSTCARNGAIWAADPTNNTYSPYTSVAQAALADAGNISPLPTVSAQTVIAGSTTYVEVSVNWTFHTITQFPGVPGSMPLTRTVRIRQEKIVPNF